MKLRVNRDFARHTTNVRVTVGDKDLEACPRDIFRLLSEAQSPAEFLLALSRLAEWREQEAEEARRLREDFYRMVREVLRKTIVIVHGVPFSRVHEKGEYIDYEEVGPRQLPAAPKALPAPRLPSTDE